MRFVLHFPIQVFVMPFFMQSNSWIFLQCKSEVDLKKTKFVLKMYAQYTSELILFHEMDIFEDIILKESNDILIYKQTCQDSYLLMLSTLRFYIFLLEPRFQQYKLKCSVSILERLFNFIFNSQKFILLTHFKNYLGQGNA